MIVEFAFRVYNYILSFITSKLPEANFPDFVQSTMSFLTEMAGQANYVVPFFLMMKAIVFIIGVEIAIMTVQAIMVIYKNLPGKAT